MTPVDGRGGPAQDGSLGAGDDDLLQILDMDAWAGALGLHSLTQEPFNLGGDPDVQREIGLLFSRNVRRMRTFGDAIGLLEETLVDPDEVPPPSIGEIAERRQRLHRDMKLVRGFVWEFMGGESHRLPRPPFGRETVCECPCGRQLFELNVTIVAEEGGAEEVDREQEQMEWALRESLEEAKRSETKRCRQGDGGEARVRIRLWKRRIDEFLVERVIPNFSEKGKRVVTGDNIEEELRVLIQKEHPEFEVEQVVDLMRGCKQKLESDEMIRFEGGLYHIDVKQKGRAKRAEEAGSDSE